MSMEYVIHSTSKEIMQHAIFSNCLDMFFSIECTDPGRRSTVVNLGRFVVDIEPKHIKHEKQIFRVEEITLQKIINILLYNSHEKRIMFGRMIYL
jgi:hypothetical protein